MLFKIFISLFFLNCSQLLACQVIYLNGTSSVGKTTLAKALQNELETPYLLVAIDKVIEMMPEKVNNWNGGSAELGFSWKKSTDSQGNPLQILQEGPFAKQMKPAMREITVVLAKNDFHLIIDDIANEKDSSVQWKNALKEHDVLWVGLTAPIEIIEKREKERGDRQVGQARAIYNEVHKGYSYDLFLDTSQDSMEEMVKKIKAACQQKKREPNTLIKK